MYSIAFVADEDQKVHLIVNRKKKKRKKKNDKIKESQTEMTISDFHKAKLIV